MDSRQLHDKETLETDGKKKLSSLVTCTLTNCNVKCNKMLVFNLKIVPQGLQFFFLPDSSGSGKPVSSRLVCDKFVFDSKTRLMLLCLFIHSRQNMSVTRGCFFFFEAGNIKPRHRDEMEI